MKKNNGEIATSEEFACELFDAMARRHRLETKDDISMNELKKGKAMLEHEPVLNGEDNGERRGREQRDESLLPDKERW
ncbi:hypothetical protein ACLOJK_016183 [Asimina triloba]